eukprot:m.1572786 g.1572786  ORF g.1572786 m.1572786 type:complete len:2487 (+) comp25302_c0_seq39:239-7699(+)
MFGSMRGKVSLGELDKKYRDPKRPPIKRIKSLKELLATHSNVKDFVKLEYADVFVLVQTAYKQAAFELFDRNEKGKNTDQPEKDILESIFGVLQVVLRHVRGDNEALARLSAIDTIIGDLLHPENYLRFRKVGVRLTVMWIISQGKSVSTAALNRFSKLANIGSDGAHENVDDFENSHRRPLLADPSFSHSSQDKDSRSSSSPADDGYSECELSDRAWLLHALLTEITDSSLQDNTDAAEGTSTWLFLHDLWIRQCLTNVFPKLCASHGYGRIDLESHLVFFGDCQHTAPAPAYAGIPVTEEDADDVFGKRDDSTAHSGDSSMDTALTTNQSRAAGTTLCPDDASQLRTTALYLGTLARWYTMLFTQTSGFMRRVCRGLTQQAHTFAFLRALLTEAVLNPWCRCVSGTSFNVTRAVFSVFQQWAEGEVQIVICDNEELIEDSADFDTVTSSVIVQSERVFRASSDDSHTSSGRLEDAVADTPVRENTDPVDVRKDIVKAEAPCDDVVTHSAASRASPRHKEESTGGRTAGAKEPPPSGQALPTDEALMSCGARTQPPSMHPNGNSSGAQVFTEGGCLEDVFDLYVALAAVCTSVEWSTIHVESGDSVHDMRNDLCNAVLRFVCEHPHRSRMAKAKTAGDASHEWFDMLVECLALLQLLATQMATQPPVTPAVASLDAVTFIVYELLGIGGYKPMLSSTTSAPTADCGASSPPLARSNRTRSPSPVVPLPELLTADQLGELLRLGLSSMLAMWGGVCVTGDAATTETTIRKYGVPFTQRLQGTFTALESRAAFQHVLTPWIAVLVSAAASIAKLPPPALDDVRDETASSGAAPLRPRRQRLRSSGGASSTSSTWMDELDTPADVHGFRPRVNSATLPTSKATPPATASKSTSPDQQSLSLSGATGKVLEEKLRLVRSKEHGESDGIGSTVASHVDGAVAAAKDASKGNKLGTYRLTSFLGRKYSFNAASGGMGQADGATAACGGKKDGAAQPTTSALSSPASTRPPIDSSTTRTLSNDRVDVVRSWTANIAALFETVEQQVQIQLWLSTLGLLGNINTLAPPFHTQCIHALSEVHTILSRIPGGCPLGVYQSADCRVPVFLPWVLDAVLMDHCRASGEQAIHFLIQTCFRQHAEPLPNTVTVQLFSVVSHVLTHGHDAVVRTLFSSCYGHGCSNSVFTSDIPGVFSLFPDFLAAVNKVFVAPLADNGSPQRSRKSASSYSSLTYDPTLAAVTLVASMACVPVAYTPPTAHGDTRDDVIPEDSGSIFGPECSPSVRLHAVSDALAGSDAALQRGTAIDRAESSTPGNEAPSDAAVADSLEFLGATTIEFVRKCNSDSKNLSPSTSSTKSVIWQSPSSGSMSANPSPIAITVEGVSTESTEVDASPLNRSSDALRTSLSERVVGILQTLALRETDGMARGRALHGLCVVVLSQLLNNGREPGVVTCIHTLLAFVDIGSSAVMQLAIQHVTAIASVAAPLRQQHPTCPNMVLHVLDRAIRHRYIRIKAALGGTGGVLGSAVSGSHTTHQKHSFTHDSRLLLALIHCARDWLLQCCDRGSGSRALLGTLVLLADMDTTPTANSAQSDATYSQTTTSTATSPPTAAAPTRAKLSPQPPDAPDESANVQSPDLHAVDTIEQAIKHNTAPTSKLGRPYQGRGGSTLGNVDHTLSRSPSTQRKPRSRSGSINRKRDKSLGTATTVAPHHSDSTTATATSVGSGSGDRTCGGAVTKGSGGGPLAAVTAALAGTASDQHLELQAQHKRIRQALGETAALSRVVLAHLSGAYGATVPSEATFGSCQETEYDAGMGVSSAAQDVSLSFFACRGNVISIRMLPTGGVRVMVRSVTRHSVHVLEEGASDVSPVCDHNPKGAPEHTPDSATAVEATAHSDRPVTPLANGEHAAATQLAQGHECHRRDDDAATLPWVKWFTRLRQAQEQVADDERACDVVLGPPLRHVPYSERTPRAPPLSGNVRANASTPQPSAVGPPDISSVHDTCRQDQPPDPDAAAADTANTWDLPGVFPSTIVEGGKHIRTLLRDHVDTTSIAVENNATSDREDVASTPTRSPIRDRHPSPRCGLRIHAVWSAATGPDATAEDEPLPSSPRSPPPDSAAASFTTTTATTTALTGPGIGAVGAGAGEGDASVAGAKGVVEHATAAHADDAPRCAGAIRRLLSHLGLLSWGDTNEFVPLPKSDRLFRELKNLDKHSPVRERHKFGVVYLAAGCTDKATILSLSHASADFERFASQLGSIVVVGRHRGYAGGLSSSYNGSRMPYYATHVDEVAFHVSTFLECSTGGARLGPGDDDVRSIASLSRTNSGDSDGFCTLPTVSLTSAGKACVSSRWRHIGNDDVHIVWSEHTEEYKVQQLPTKFGRVTLVLYPLRNGMIRIQVIQKQALRVWPGPVIDGSVVDRVSAAPMVRLTALNVSREIRAEASLSPHYQIRKDYLQRIVALKSVSPFEDDMGSLVNGRSKAANARARTTPSSTPTAVSGQ